MKRIAFFLLVACLAFVGLSGSPSRLSPRRGATTVGPEESLDALAASVQRRDWEGFGLYVDVDSVAESLVDATIEKEIERRFKDDGSGMLARAFAASIRPRLVREAKAQMRKAVESSSDSQLKRAVETFRTGTRKDVEKSGDLAKVRLEGRGLKRPRVLELEMRRSGDHWKVVRILNADDLV